MDGKASFASLGLHLAPRRLKKLFFFLPELLALASTLQPLAEVMLLALEGGAVCDDDGVEIDPVLGTTSDEDDADDEVVEENDDDGEIWEAPDPMGVGLEMAVGFAAFVEVEDITEVAEVVEKEMGSACMFNCSIRGVMGRESKLMVSSSSASSSWWVSDSHGAFDALTAAIDSFLAFTERGGLPLPAETRWKRLRLEEDVEETPNGGELGANIEAK